jgi:hypothetical protein
MLENATADVVNRSECTREKAACGPDNRKKSWNVVALFARAGFDPEAIATMTAAYRAALSELRLSDCEDAATLMVASRMIEIVERGERDPQKLVDAVLEALSR